MCVCVCVYDFAGLLHVNIPKYKMLPFNYNVFYSKTCAFYDPTKIISVIIVFFENNVIVRVMQDFFVLVYI